MSKKLSHYLLSLLALGAASCTSQQEIEDMSETTEERPDVGTLSDDIALLCPSKSICQQIVTPKICISCRIAIPSHRETFANTVLIC